MSNKKKQKTPYSDKSKSKDEPAQELKFIKGTPEDIFPALVEHCCDAVMERIMPALEKTFDEQNAYIQKLIERSLNEGYKILLEHSIDERKETLETMEKEADDGNE